MHDDLATAVDELFPALRAELEAMVRIPSVSSAAFDPGQVRRSAEHVAEALRRHGFEDVQLLESADAHPAVFGRIDGPDGAPTVLLYAHHDVQPPGPDALWSTPPFEPVERDGRLYGRGSSDDKAGIAVHLGAVAAHGGRPPVGIKVFFEGEEEIGSEHLPDFLARYRDLLAADVFVIADSENWRVGAPALTTSLRGLVDCVVEVRTLDLGVHSGQFGGAVPDALTTMCRLLATLHDDEGNVAIAGLGGYPVDPLDLDEEELRAQAGTRPGTALIGSGALTERMWTRPSCSVLAIDAPPVAEAINQLVPAARAKVSVRIPPGVEAATALASLTAHLETRAPWGAEVVVTPGAAGEPVALSNDGEAADAWRAGMEAAFGTSSVDIGVGGSIPFVAEFQRTYPGAAILLTGAADPTSRAHGPDESLDLDDLRRSVLAEAIALRMLAGNTPAG